MDVPGVGPVDGEWDLRHCIEKYLGRYDFAGKRAIDVGSASGYLSFAMEQRGAEVVSFDQADADGAEKNAYWFTHARLGSKAKVFYGDLDDIPDELGPFDVALLSMVVSRAREPFQAIYSAARLCRRDVILTTELWESAPWRAEPKGALFVPSRTSWKLSRSCLERMLRVMGFEVVRVFRTRPRHRIAEDDPVKTSCFTLVATRVAD
jgi:hypothetical protein